MSLAPRSSPTQPRVLRVSELNRVVRATLEDDFRDVWVEGEITEAKRAPSGHWYFNLSDERDPAQVRCVMFRSDAMRTRATLRNGERVRVRGQLTLYEPRGSYQLIVRAAVAAGDGDLRARFEMLRRKIAAEGLLDTDRKRPLPRLPRTVGLVTSGSSAAYQDVLRVSAARCPLRIVLSDCRVQGETAPASIVEALRRVQRLPELDVVILTRGGGSAEDLWSFNDERVVRAVATCRVPIVVGVGHETDVTLAELVADVRAATPSNAAEIVVPERATLRAEVEGMERRLARALETRLDRERLQLERAGRRLLDPRSALGRAQRDMLRLTNRLEEATRRMLKGKALRTKSLAARVQPHDPRLTLERQARRLELLSGALTRAHSRKMGAQADALRQLREALLPSGMALTQEARGALAKNVAALDALSPLRVLGRGYAIALGPGGRALRGPEDVAAGDQIEVRVARAAVQAEVLSVDRLAPESTLGEEST